MPEEIIEEHKHVVTETDEGTTETHSHKIVEQGGEVGRGRPEITTIEKDTIIEEDD